MAAKYDQLHKVTNNPIKLEQNQSVFLEGMCPQSVTDAQTAVFP